MVQQFPRHETDAHATSAFHQWDTHSVNGQVKEPLRWSWAQHNMTRLETRLLCQLQLFMSRCFFLSKHAMKSAGQQQLLCWFCLFQTQRNQVGEKASLACQSAWHICKNSLKFRIRLWNSMPKLYLHYFSLFAKKAKLPWNFSQL